MDKPTVYVDTNIFSVLHYPGYSQAALLRHQTTQEWWHTERPFYRVYSSRAVADELTAGRYPGQKRAMAEARRLPYLPFSRAVTAIAGKYIENQILTASSKSDAVQLAIAAVHGVDYLLSWNRAHLANPLTQARLAEYSVLLGLRPPLIVTPDTIPRVARGEQIRRRD